VRMRYRFRYNIGPLYAERPFGRRGPGGLMARLLSLVWSVVAFILQLVVWAVLLVVGLVYTVIWLILWPFHRLFARPAAGRRI
jgi:hypothetical protein